MAGCGVHRLFGSVQRYAWGMPRGGSCMVFAVASQNELHLQKLGACPPPSASAEGDEPFAEVGSSSCPQPL